MPKQSAVFLDRDGTIIEDVGHINDSSFVRFYAYTSEALKKLGEHYVLFIITNQSGVSKGIITEKEVIAVNNYIVNTLRLSDIMIQDTFYCTHKNEDRCRCKKPSPFFIHRAAEVYDIDLNSSFIIGDHPSDIECGLNAGVTPIYLLSGHGKKHLDELKYTVQICHNILEASQLILSMEKK